MIQNSIDSVKKVWKTWRCNKLLNNITDTMLTEILDSRLINKMEDLSEVLKDMMNGAMQCEDLLKDLEVKSVIVTSVGEADDVIEYKVDIVVDYKDK